MKKLPALLLLLLLGYLSSCGQRTNTTTEQTNTNTTTPIKEAKKEQSLELAPVLLSKDFGKTWKSVSQGLPTDTKVSFMEFKGEEIVMASDNQGVFLSTNQRSQWKQIGEKLPGKKINALHVVDNTIYVGVYKNGIYKTDNEGENWQTLNVSLPSMSVQAIWQMGDQLYVGTDDGLFMLPKGKKTWQTKSIKAQVLSIYDYQGVLVAGTSQGSAISRDQGQTWTWVRQEGAVHYTHNIGQRMVEFNIDGDLYYSDDWGQTWTETVYEPRARNSYIYEMVPVGNFLLMSNNYGIHRSTNQGVAWEHNLKTEKLAFFDFLVLGNEVYGGTRLWDEYRGRSKN